MNERLWLLLLIVSLVVVPIWLYDKIKNGKDDD